MRLTARKIERVQFECHQPTEMLQSSYKPSQLPSGYSTNWRNVNTQVSAQVHVYTNAKIQIHTLIFNLHLLTKPHPIRGITNFISTNIYLTDFTPLCFISQLFKNNFLLNHQKMWNKKKKRCFYFLKKEKRTIFQKLNFYLSIFLVN